MLMKVIRVDPNGLFLEDVLIEDGQEIPSDCISDLVQPGLYLPRWDGTAWVEGMEQAKIDKASNQVMPKTEIEKLKERQDSTENAILFLMDTMGVM